MQPDIKCDRCQTILSDSGFIRLKNMVKRKNIWCVMCHQCNALHYLKKLNNANSARIKIS